MVTITSPSYQAGCFTPYQATPFLVFSQNVNVLETSVDVRMYFYSEKFLLWFGRVSPQQTFCDCIELGKFKTLIEQIQILHFHKSICLFITIDDYASSGLTVFHPSYMVG